MNTPKDEFGDRMKFLESFETGRRFLPQLPVYARIDGRGFSKFTRGMSRPFDLRMTDAMVETTRYLVKETHAVIGFTESDEISLLWYSDDYTKSIFFDGKIQKMTSVLASMAAAKFNREIRGWVPFEDRYPAFDARVIQLPSQTEAANMFLWRAIDARKNAVSMACRHYYSAKEMHGKNQATMLEMLAAKDVVFEDYPTSFRLGTYLRRRTYEKEIDGINVIRSEIAPVDLPPLRTIANRVGVIFNGDAPVGVA